MGSNKVYLISGNCRCLEISGSLQVQCCIPTSSHHQKALPLSFKAPLRFKFHLSNHPAQPFFLCRSIEIGSAAPCCGNLMSGAGRRLVPRPDSNGAGAGEGVTASMTLCRPSGPSGTAGRPPPDTGGTENSHVSPVLFTDANRFTSVSLCRVYGN